MTRTAYIGADVFDGDVLHSDSALLIEDGVLLGVVSTNDVPERYAVTQMRGGTILPGFIDLQVNGGGGVMFNSAPTVETLETIARAHASTGTLAFLPTLITDTPDHTRAAIAAVEAAIAQGVPGIIGIHLEGPHLSVERKGAHDPKLIRPMSTADEAQIIEAAKRLPNLMMTLAPENARPDQISRLVDAGVIVSLGHTDCQFSTAISCFDQGASCVTHLFNAMSQLGNREPGVVGAALHDGRISAGLIADGVHVHLATIRAAMAAKTGPGRIFLVTDAMATVGSDISEFSLNGRVIHRKDGRLTLADGTLAGADLEMPKAIGVMLNDVGVEASEAFAMATSAPAAVLRDDLGFGHFRNGQKAHAIHLSEDLSVTRFPE